MYQVPVEDVETIRKTRGKVKHILSDIGLEDCQNFLEEYHKPDPDDDIFPETEWTDFSEGVNRRKKKWIYRSKALCCSLCEYQTLNWRNFKHHLQRNHEYGRKMCALSPCPSCPFVGHPKAVRKHIWLFHSQPSITPTGATTESLLVTSKKGERYRCQKCSFQSSVLFAMKKHVLLAHLGNLNILSQFSRRKPDPLNRQTFQYYCTDCDIALQNLDHLLHHVLVKAAHRSVKWHVKPFIIDNRSGQVIASKAQQAQMLSSGLLFPPANDQQAGNMLQQPGAPLSATVMHGSPNNGSFMYAPGTNQSLLPAQASALVRLATAEAKGLLKPGTTISFQGALAPGALPATMPLPGSIGPAMVRLPTPSNSASKQVPLGVGTLGQHPLQQWPQQVLLPQVNMPGLGGTGPHPLMVTQKLPLNQTAPQSTVLSSQSLLSHLIPTGNKINGMPTYTFAPLKMTVPGGKETSRNTASPLQPIKPRMNHSSEAKRWVACPICNELFPSDVYEVHTQVVHKATSKHECLAAKAPYLKKMPDKTVKCLMCKVSVSEKGLIEHLLHGLDCIFCPSKFNSIKKLVEHSKEHNTSSQTEYCEFIRREYRLYTNDSGKLMFPYFDINTSAPKHMLGDSELNLALVTKSLDHIFLKMLPSNGRHAVCSTPMTTIRTCCLFCDENCQTPEKYQQHLRQKHFVDTTMHAIHKTAAFKCIYCNGVYTGKVSQKGIAFHLRRCQCAPKAPTNTEKAPTSAKKPLTNGQAVLPAPNNEQTALLPDATKGLQTNQAPAFYFSQHPQAPVQSPAPPQYLAEQLSKLRLEMAWKKVMEANRQERKERAAQCLRLQKEKAVQLTSKLEIEIDPTVELALDPSGLEQQPTEERKHFLTRYFHKCPHATKKESDELSKRLLLTKCEVAVHFSKKRTKCMRTMNKNTAAVLLGFNMSELNKVKHNLLIPAVAPAHPVRFELVQSEEIEKKAKLDVSGDVENMEESNLLIPAHPERIELVQSEEIEEKAKLDESGDMENMEESDKINCQKEEVKDKLEEVAEAELMAF